MPWAGINVSTFDNIYVSRIVNILLELHQTFESYEQIRTEHTLFLKRFTVLFKLLEVDMM